MDSLISGVHALSRAFGVLAASCLAAACLVVCQMVFLRYVMGASTTWQSEFVGYAVAASTLFGSPYVLLERGHVNMDLLPHYLGNRGRLVLALVASLLGASFCAILAWKGSLYFYEAWSEGWRTETVWAPPLWAVLLPMPIGIGLLTLQYLIDILCLLTGRELPFGLPPADPANVAGKMRGGS
jgi:TRAP-type C4-dicarboxylate transport system permease small subunit